MVDLEKQSIKQFNAWAKDYDHKYFWPFYFANRAVLDLLDPKPRTAILDVGCGTGILLKQLLELERNLSLFGVDIAPEMVRVAQAKLGMAVEIREGSADALVYEDELFDSVTCATSFHHYPQPATALREMYRVLKPGGKLVMLDPFTDGWVRHTICRLLDKLFAEVGTKLFTREQMRRMFSEVGFEHVTQRTYGYYKLMTVGVKSDDVGNSK